MSTPISARDLPLYSTRMAEAVLAILLPVFTFELPKDSIMWNIAAVNYPTMGKEATKPCMRLKIGFVKDVKKPGGCDFADAK